MTPEEKREKVTDLASLIMCDKEIMGILSEADKLADMGNWQQFFEYINRIHDQRIYEFIRKNMTKVAHSLIQRCNKALDAEIMEAADKFKTIEDHDPETK